MVFVVLIVFLYANRSLSSLRSSVFIEPFVLNVVIFVIITVDIMVISDSRLQCSQRSQNARCTHCVHITIALIVSIVRLVLIALILLNSLIVLIVSIVFIVKQCVHRLCLLLIV